MSNNRKKRKTQPKKTHHKNNIKQVKKKGKPMPEPSFFEKVSQAKAVDACLKFFKKINFKTYIDKLKKIDLSKVLPKKKVKADTGQSQKFGHFFEKMKIYLKKNRNQVIFFASMPMIMAAIYFGISYMDSKADSQPTAEVVNLDLSELNSNMLADVESGLTGNSSADVVVDLQVQGDDVAVAPSLAKVTKNSVDGVYEVKAPATAAQVSAQAEAMMSVQDAMVLGVTSYAIKADDKPVAYFKTEAQAQEFLENLRLEFKDPEAVEERVIFKENITVEKYKNDILEFEGYKDSETVMEYIKKGTNEQKIHRVAEGENFWVIAESNGMNPYDLIEANPGINEKRLQIGTELSLIVAEPIINVLSISTFERKDELPFGRGENVPTDKYFVGRSVTKVAGVPGEAVNMIEVYTENGKIIGEKILSSEVIREPVDMVSYVGTKPAPPSIGTGSFAKPTSRGYVTSNYGSRAMGWHTGIDIGVGMHSNVLAADGGRVIFAGYKGSYGKLVIIDHGANKTTYYAHNDQFLVSSGENVFKGQPIALSGSTGRSTGPHLHFEIRVNNEPMDPRKYVNY